MLLGRIGLSHLPYKVGADMVRSAKWYAVAALFGAVAGGVVSYVDHAPVEPTRHKPPIVVREEKPPVILPVQPTTAPLMQLPGEADTPPLVSQADPLASQGVAARQWTSSERAVLDSVGAPRTPSVDTALPTVTSVGVISGVKEPAATESLGRPVYNKECLTTFDEAEKRQFKACRLVRRGTIPR